MRVYFQNLGHSAVSVCCNLQVVSTFLLVKNLLLSWARFCCCSYQKQNALLSREPSLVEVGVLGAVEMKDVGTML